ncbi:hypothetical protein GCM10027610_064000 [Dactylosporangium cerinum]
MSQTVPRPCVVSVSRNDVPNFWVSTATLPLYMLLPVPATVSTSSHEPMSPPVCASVSTCSRDGVCPSLATPSTTFSQASLPTPVEASTISWGTPTPATLPAFAVKCVFAAAVASVAETFGAMSTCNGVTRLLEAPRYAPPGPVCTTMSPP